MVLLAKKKTKKTLHASMTSIFHSIQNSLVNYVESRVVLHNFKVDAILFREIQCKENDVLALFRCDCGWNQLNCARITITRAFSLHLHLLSHLRVS